MPLAKGKMILVDDPKTDIRSPQERFIEEQIKFKNDVTSKPQSANVPTSISAVVPVPTKVAGNYGCGAIWEPSADIEVIFRAMNKSDLALQKISFVNWFYDLKFIDLNFLNGLPGGYAGTTDFSVDLYMTFFGDNALNFDALMCIPIGTLSYSDNIFGLPNNGQGAFGFTSTTGEISNTSGKLNVLENAMEFRNFDSPCFLGDFTGTNSTNQPNAITLEQIDKWFTTTDENIAYDVISVGIAGLTTGLSVANASFYNAMAQLEWMLFQSTFTMLFRGNQGVYKVTRTI